jgi:hypothetical protein
MTYVLRKLRAFISQYRFAVQAIVISAVSYATALIATYIGNITPGSRSWIVIVLGGFIVVVIMTLISTLVDNIIRQQDKATEREHNIHKTGYFTLNREINNYIRILREVWGRGDKIKVNMAIELMNKAVSELYETLEAEYGTSVSIDERIEFEVTFMTKSLRDQKITIAAWANRDGRAPKSLAKRSFDSELYSETETAKLYDDENRTVRIIETTAIKDYKELYPGQKTRIRSSIIYPVLDDAFDLLGTLVVHCDQDGFFKSNNAKFWRELLEPYTKRLALARIAAEKLTVLHQQERLF